MGSHIPELYWPHRGLALFQRQQGLTPAVCGGYNRTNEIRRRQPLFLALMLTQSSESTSRSLIRRAIINDPVAWQRLSQIYGPLVYQWCRHCGLQPDDAADVVQEVFQSLAKSLGTFRRDKPTDSFRAWLWTITHNKLQDHHRRTRRRPQALGGSTAHQELQQLPDLAPEETNAAHGQQVRSELARRALALMQQDFEEHTWRAFWKTAVDQQTASQAAEELGISVASVYMAKSRVLRRLREELHGLDLLE